MELCCALSEQPLLLLETKTATASACMLEAVAGAHGQRQDRRTDLLIAHGERGTQRRQVVDGLLVELALAQHVPVL